METECNQAWWDEHENDRARERCREPEPRKNKTYVIRHSQVEAYWTVFGWVKREAATQFTEEEMNFFNLPTLGIWEEII